MLSFPKFTLPVEKPRLLNRMLHWHVDTWKRITSSEGPCSAQRLLFFVITCPLIEVTSRLFWSNSVGFREDFIFLPQLQQIIPDVPVGIAVKTLLFGRIFVKFEGLGVVQVDNQILRFSAEVVDLLRLAQVLNEWPFKFVILEFLDQHFDLVLACCIQVLGCRKRKLQVFCVPVLLQVSP